MYLIYLSIYNLSSSYLKKIHSRNDYFFSKHVSQARFPPNLDSLWNIPKETTEYIAHPEAICLCGPVSISNREIHSCLCKQDGYKESRPPSGREKCVHFKTFWAEKTRWDSYGVSKCQGLTREWAWICSCWWVTVSLLLPSLLEAACLGKRTSDIYFTGTGKWLSQTTLAWPATQ